jgi:hypothetical protein
MATRVHFRRDSASPMEEHAVSWRKRLATVRAHSTRYVRLLRYTLGRLRCPDGRRGSRRLDEERAQLHGLSASISLARGASARFGTFLRVS